MALGVMVGVLITQSPNIYNYTYQKMFSKIPGLRAILPKPNLIIDNEREFEML